MTKKKHTTYVLDTNVLVHDPHALFDFGSNIVGIPTRVIEELDTFKKEGTDRGRNAREAIRLLDKLRTRGSLGEGVTLDNGGMVKVLFLSNELPPMPFKLNIADNEILLTVLSLRDQGADVIFISKDLNARVKASALGIPSEDYLKEHVSESDFYHGWIQSTVPAAQLKTDSPKILSDLAKEYNFTRHEYALLVSQNNPFNNRVFRYIGDKGFRPVYHPQLRWPLHARNPQQLMALDALMDDSIQFVTLLGAAGTGKTFLALLAGLHKVLIEDQYERILICRPVIPLGRDIGYLPGDVKEKIHSWMMPIYDNMDFIIHSINVPEETYEMRIHKRREYRNQKGYNNKHEQRNEKRKMMQFNDLVREGKISMEPITYMRGRSIPYQYILIDEAQNLSPHEVKTLITRVGEGSKIVLVGDPYQIDSLYLDFSSNGLVVASEKFKGQSMFATVALETSERSQLSKLAGELL
ncbi:MAG TPA: PhoH family protein [Candidatus Babeliales bacterium]|jgi:PhoH-like ATPase|nr:PhoH family protein [Candidatus Babeliales bacterium]